MTYELDLCYPWAQKNELTIYAKKITAQQMGIAYKILIENFDEWNVRSQKRDLTLNTMIIDFALEEDIDQFIFQYKLQA